MADEYNEDSPILNAFKGKYLIMKRCSKCKQMSTEFDDFIDFQFRGFTGEDSDHIYNVRKEYGVDASAAASIWSMMKPFNYYWATIWDATLEDYFTSHFSHDLVRTEGK